MGLHTLGHIVVIAALLLLMWMPAGGQAPLPEGTVTVLRDILGLPAADLDVIAAGRAVARAVATSAVEESAATGAVLIHAPVERLLAEFTNIETSRRGPGVKALGVFGEQPSLGDLGTFTLTADELAGIRRCRPGDCALKLPAAMIARFRSEVDWGSPRAPADATALMRQWLHDELTVYRRDGPRALGLVDDKRPPLDRAHELSQLLSHDVWLTRLAPQVGARLSAFPGGSSPDVRHAFYWARVDFGMKPTIRLNHVSIHPTPDAPHGLSHVIATTQIYASHYLRAAVELRLVFPRPEGGFVLVMATRSRNDGMTGLLGFVVRAKVRGQSRDAMVRYLQNVKATLENGRRGEVVGAGSR